MYYEEKMINGILHWRGGEDEMFKPVDIKKLSRRCVSQKDRLDKIGFALSDIMHALEANPECSQEFLFNCCANAFNIAEVAIIQDRGNNNE